MDKPKLESYFKLFTSTDAELFFDAELKRKSIEYIKREVPNSRFFQYFFNPIDIPYVEEINEDLKIKEHNEVCISEERKYTILYAFELLLALSLVVLAIVFVLSI